MKIFCSGSCRMFVGFEEQNNMFDDIVLIHSMNSKLKGTNFMGKQHNIKQHIQFIKYIRKDIQLPDHILPRFFTAIRRKHKRILQSCRSLNEQFCECDWYIFEICSIKIHTIDGFQVMEENCRGYAYDTAIQTEDELLDDFISLSNLIPENKKILFQVHFRPNIIHDNDAKIIENREIIYRVAKKFCNIRSNTYVHDPSIILKNNLNAYDDDVHFNNNEHKLNFKYIRDNYLFN